MPGCGCHGGGYSWKHALLAVAAPQLTERDSCVDSRGMCVNGRVRKVTDVVPEALPEDIRKPSAAFVCAVFCFYGSRQQRQNRVSLTGIRTWREVKNLDIIYLQNRNVGAGNSVMSARFPAFLFRLTPHPIPKFTSQSPRFRLFAASFSHFQTLPRAFSGYGKARLMSP